MLRLICKLEILETYYIWFNFSFLKDMVSTQNWRISPVFISYYVSQSRAPETEYIMNDILCNLIYKCSSVTNNKHRIFNCLSKSKALNIQYIMSDIIFDITYDCLSVIYNTHRISHCLPKSKSIKYSMHHNWPHI